MKRLLSGLLVLAMLLGMVGAGAVSVPSVRAGADDTQSTSPKETVYVNSYGGTERTIDFDSHWKFYLGDAGSAHTPVFNDSTWKDVNLPHDYSIEQAFTQSGEAESGYLMGGIGWYRKSFTVSPDWRGKDITLNFDGVYMDSTVWLNGTQLGTHPYGYTPFSFKLPADKLNFDGVNVIAVKVNHQTPSSRWYSGSGIYRDVKLTVTDSVHVALNGTTVTTPNLEAEYKAEGKVVNVHVDTMVSNDGNAPQSVTIKQTVYHKGGAAASDAVTTGAVEIAAGATTKISATVPVTNPDLWAVGSPNLYTVRTEVLVDAAVKDTYDTDFGFRWFVFDTNTGFALNGEQMKLQGVCMHHDQGALGAEAWYRATERQVELLLEMGINSIRVTHNPASSTLIDICNKKGVLVIDEIFDGWHLAKNGNNKDYARYFTATIEAGNTLLGGAPGTMTWAEYDLKATIGRGKNSPAIIAWSLGNEIQEGASNIDNGYPAHATDLIRWTREADLARPATFGDNTRGGPAGSVNIHNQLANAGTVATGAIGGTIGGLSGYNYSDDGTYDSAHRDHPTWALYGAETASHTNSRGVYDRKNNNSDGNGDRRLTAYDKSSVGWGAKASDAWYRTIINDYNAGEYAWTGFDYIGEPTPWNGTGSGASGGLWPAPKSSYFGIIETTGFPKDNFWFYQSQWNKNVNTLHMLPTWNRDEIVIDSSNNVEVVVYTDAAKVELYFTPKSGGERTKVGEQVFYTRASDTGHYSYQSTAQTGGGHQNLYMTFQVPYQEGTLEAVGYDKDGAVITNTQGRSSVTTTGSAAQLQATADRSVIKADGKDLSYITIDVQDIAGNFINGAEPTIKLSITGDGVIVGTDSGFQNDHVSYQATTKKAFNGKLLAIVQSTEKAGSFTLTAQADGLTKSSVTVTTTPVGGGSDRNLTSYDIAKNYYVKVGNMPVLPTAVTAHYSDGSDDEINVVWDAFDKTLINRAGAFVVSGKLGSTPYTVTVNINMLDEVAALLSYSAAVQLGGELNLPESRPAVMADGTILAAAFPVIWTMDDFDNTKAGVYVLPGEATVLGKPLEVTATVRVSAPSISVGSNVMAAGVGFTQSIPEADQSGVLGAIRDGVKTVANETSYWSSEKAAQKGQRVNSIAWRYDTAQLVGTLKLYFHTDATKALALPDGVKLEWSPNGADWTVISAKASADKVVGAVAERTYTFPAVEAVNFRITFTDKAGSQSGKRNATALVEAELFRNDSSFTVNSSDALTAITVNGVAATAAELTSRMIKHPAYFAQTLEIESGNHAAYTVLPAHENIVRILTESEDHTLRGAYQIKLAQSAGNMDPADGSRDYPFSKTTATAGSWLATPSGNEGPASQAVDGDTGTMWHSNWSTATPENPTDLTSKPESRWFTIQMQEAATLDGLRYLPRSNGSNGTIENYKIEVSMTGQADSWTQVATGTWANNTQWKAASFAPTEAKYVKIWGVSTYGDYVNKFMSALEFRVCVNQPVGVDLSAATVTFDVPSFEYTGAPVAPKPNVVLDGRKLLFGIDYTVGYSANTDPGSVTCTVRGILNYSGTASGTFTIAQSAATVLSYTEPTIKTFVGVDPTAKLPAKVKGLTNTGLEMDFDVTWGSISASDYASGGSFVVEGTVSGQSVKPTATVLVVSAVSAQSVSAVVVKGADPVLPEQVTVHLSDGTSGQYPVTWTPGDYSTATTVEVSGTVDLGNSKIIAATASVRVEEGTATGNIALNTAKNLFPLALGYISAGDNNPYAAIDGNSTYTQRWCDWESGKYHTDPKSWVAVAPTGTSVPGDRNASAEVTLEKQIVSQVKIVFADESPAGTGGDVTYPADYEVQYFRGNADTMTIDTTLSPTSNAKQGNGMVVALGTSHPLNTDANWITVDYTGTKPAVVETRDTVLTVNFEAVNTSLIRVIVTPKAKWTGIAEFEVYGLSAGAAHSDFTVSDITIDGTDKKGDFADKELTVSSLPTTITATATNNASVTVVPGKAGGDAKVIFTSEDGSATETYTIHITAANAYDVTVGSADHGTVTAAATAVTGDTVLLTVKPDRGYQLKSLTTDDVDTAIAHNRFTMPGKAVTVTAEFEPITYQLTYTLNDGTVETPNPTTYTVETPTITLNAPAKANTSFLGWTGGGLTESTRAVTIPMGSIGDRTYTAHYGQLYTITVNSGANGAATVTSATAQAGDTILVTVTPADGYELDTMTAVRDDTSASVTVDSRNTFAMPAANVTVTAAFRAATYAIEYHLDGGALADGATNPTTYTIASGEITLAKPTKENAAFAGWLLEGETVPVLETKIPVGSFGDRSYTAIYYVAHDITAVGLNDGTVTATPASAIKGDTVNLELTPSTGYQFKANSLKAYKTGDVETEVTLNDLSFTMPDYPVTVTADFEPVVYTLTYNLDGGALAAGQTNPVNYTVKSDAITLHNPTKSGAEFVGWTGTDVAENTLSVTIPKGSTGNRSYTAHYEVSYPVVITQPTNGTVVALPVTAKEGQSVTLTVTPNDGYELDTLTAVQTGTSTSVPIVEKAFTMPAAGVTVTATFRAIEYAITYELNGGTVDTANPATYTIETPSFTLNNPTKPGQPFSGWTGTGLTNPTTSVTIPQGSTGERTYTANYGALHAVTATATGHGTLTAAPVSAAQGTAVTVSVAPTEGYRLKAGTLKAYKTGVPGTVVEMTESGFTMPDYAVTVVAEFEPITYTLTYVLNGGVLADSVTNPATYTIESESITLNNPAKANALFQGWTGEDHEQPTTTVSIPKGSMGNRTYTAVFTDVYAVSVVTLENGTLTATPNSGIQGAAVTITATPDVGYQLKADSLRAYKTGESGTPVALNGMTFTMPGYGVTVTAEFEPITYSITYVLGGGVVTPENPTVYTIESESITLREPVKEGAEFRGWTGEGLTQPVKAVTIPKGSIGNRTYTANYGTLFPVMAANVEHGTLGVAPATAAEGTAITITVNPASGYRLKDGTLKAFKTGDETTTVALSGYSFTMPAHAVTVTAEFEVVPSSGGSSGGNSSTVTNPDGSKTTTTVTGSGTTATTKYPDGSMTVVKTKKDGTVTEERTLKNGTTSSAVTQPDGKVSAEVTLGAGATGTVELPLSPIGAGQNSATAPTVTVKTEKGAAVIIPVKDAKSSTVAILVKEDGTEELLPLSVLTDKGMGILLEGSATVKLVDNAKTFADVTEKHWANDAIAFATSRELFRGVGSGNFDPTGTMSRSMLVTVLWRMNGTPEAAANTEFSDVAGGTWYTDAVNWAADAGVVTGSGSGFDPNGTLTRETLVTMLYRSAQNIDMDTEKSGSLTDYSDAATVSEWSADAMSWAVGMGIIRSNAAGKLDPSGVATRAEAVTILQRFVSSMF